MANLIRGAFKVQATPFYMSSDGRKWDTVAQANTQQRYINKQLKLQALLQKYRIAMPSNKYVISTNVLLSAIRDNPRFLRQLAALA